MQRLNRSLACLSTLCLAFTVPTPTFGDESQSPGPEGVPQDNEQQATSLVSELNQFLADEALSDVERVRGFHRITAERSLSFVGYIRVYAGRSYLDTFQSHKQQYSECMDELTSKIDVTGLLDSAKERMGDDPLVSADAMTLAAMIDWDTSLPVLVEMSNPDIVRRAMVRPFHVHALCLLAAAKRSDEIVEALRPILKLTKNEEMREDILCAISALDHDRATGWVKGYVEENLAGEFNQAMQTALLILNQRLDPEAYRAFVTGMLSSVDEDEHLAQLTRYRDAPPAYGGLDTFPGAPWTNKGWDGFHFTIQKHGVTVSYGDRFEVFVPD